MTFDLPIEIHERIKSAFKKHGFQFMLISFKSLEKELLKLNNPEWTTERCAKMYFACFSFITNIEELEKTGTCFAHEMGFMDIDKFETYYMNELEKLISLQASADDNLDQ